MHTAAARDIGFTFIVQEKTGTMRNTVAQKYYPFKNSSNNFFLIIVIIKTNLFAHNAFPTHFGGKGKSDR